MTDKKVDNHIPEFDTEKWNTKLKRLQTYMVKREKAIYKKNVTDHIPKSDDDLVPDAPIADGKYFFEDINCDSIYKILLAKGVNHSNAERMTIQIATAVILRLKRESTKSRKKLTDAIKHIEKTIECLQHYEAHNNILFSKHFRLNGSNPITDLAGIQMNVIDALVTHFPNGKQRIVHDELVRKVAHLWRQNIGEPTRHDESAFIEVISLCIGSSPEVTNRMVSRIVKDAGKF